MNIEKKKCAVCGAKMTVHQLRCVAINKEEKTFVYEVTRICSSCKVSDKAMMTVKV